MSKTTCTTFSPKLHATFEASLNEYEKKTEINLLTHPLVARLQECNSPSDILVVLRSQVPHSEQTTSANEKLIKWLDPIVNVLFASSGVISACVGLVNSIQMLFLQFSSNRIIRISSYSHLQISFSLAPVSSFRKLSSWIACCDFDDDDIGTIGTGRTRGGTMEELDALSRSSGSSSGAGGNDLRFDLAMVGYRGTRGAILSQGKKRLIICG